MRLEIMDASLAPKKHEDWEISKRNFCDGGPANDTAKTTALGIWYSPIRSYGPSVSNCDFTIFQIFERFFSLLNFD
jgi:hypothetical protein